MKARGILTPKQKAFVEEYLVDLNATQSAIRAGYSPRTAYRTGADNLKKPQISEAIQAGKDKRSAKTEITAEKVVRELDRIAFTDPSEIVSVVDGRVKIKDTSELTAAQRMIVSELGEVTTASGTNIRLKTQDRIRALELLGKHLGVFPSSKLEVSGPGGGPIPLVAMSDAELERIASGVDS